MFKKALAHQSNATPLRSSTRRQLLASVYSEYPALRDCIAPEGSAETEGKLPEKDLGRLLVPDGVRITSIETSGGVGGSLYISPDGEPVWMTFGHNSKTLIPTLSLLASLPTFVQPLPILELPYPLPPPLLSGAALFLGAVRHLHKPWRLPVVPEGAMVALVAPVDPNQPGKVSYVGVGHVVASGGLSGALERRKRHLQDGKDHDDGKFCEIMCIIDDHLWVMGSKPSLSAFTLPQPRESLAPPPEGEAAPLPAVSDSQATADAPVAEEASTEPLTAAEISTLLTASLHQTLTTISPSILPLPASQLYSAHILPSRPAYIPPSRREDVVIARSEWKKLAKWMKDAAKQGVIKIKESKTDVNVTGFDPSHALLQAHAPFKTIGEEETRAAKRAAREAAEAEPAGKQMDIQEMWKPAGSAAAFWEACGIEKSSLNPGGAIKSAFDEYVTKHKLVDTNDHRKVTMDKVLASAVGAKEGQTLVRDEITRRLRASVSWNVVIGGVVKKGALSPVTMVVKTRQGRKQVTLISGLEGFGIDIDDFAEELRKVCAGATSIQPLTGASPKLNLKEVLVQGSQSKLVTEALVARGVPKRWIKDEGSKK